MGEWEGGEGWGSGREHLPVRTPAHRPPLPTRTEPLTDVTTHPQRSRDERVINGIGSTDIQEKEDLTPLPREVDQQETAM